MPFNDVWETSCLNPKAKKRELAILPKNPYDLKAPRIIELTTQKGDFVLEPFCGSGTTCVATDLLERKYLGIDKSSDAVPLSLSRLKNPIKTNSNLLKNGRESYVNADRGA